MTLKQLKEKEAEILKRSDDFIGVDKFTPEKRAEHDRLCRDLTAIGDEIEQHKRSLERQGTGGPPSGVLCLNDDGTSATSTRAVASGVGFQFRSAAQLGLSEGDHGFETANDFYRAVLSSRFDPRLEERAAGQNETVPSAGGFAIPGTFLFGAWNTVIEASAFMQAATTYQIGNGNLTIPALDAADHSGGLVAGGVTAAWTAEEGTIATSTSKLRSVQLTPNGLKCLVPISREILSNQAVDMAQVMGDAIFQQMGWTIDEAILRGDGAGKPMGILSAAATVSQAKESGQAGATLVAENIFAMWSRLLGGSHQNAIWFCNADVLPSLYGMAISVGTGGSAIYQPAGGASETPFSTLMGRPLVVTEKCSTLGTVGDLVLADMRQYALGIRRDLQIDRSEHAYFTTDQVALRGVAHLDGQPLLNTPVQPYKGASTLSHFVTLATRS